MDLTSLTIMKSDHSVHCVEMIRNCFRPELRRGRINCAILWSQQDSATARSGRCSSTRFLPSGTFPGPPRSTDLSICDFSFEDFEMIHLCSQATYIGRFERSRLRISGSHGSFCTMEIKSVNRRRNILIYEILKYILARILEKAYHTGLMWMKKGQRSSPSNTE